MSERRWVILHEVYSSTRKALHTCIVVQRGIYTGVNFVNDETLSLRVKRTCTPEQHLLQELADSGDLSGSWENLQADL